MTTQGIKVPIKIVLKGIHVGYYSQCDLEHYLKAKKAALKPLYNNSQK